MIEMNRKQIAEEFSKSIDYPEIDKIILLGSVARGEDTEESDIALEHEMFGAFKHEMFDALKIIDFQKPQKS